MVSVPNAPEEDVIGLLMDDVDTGTVNAASLVRTMQSRGFDVASPSFPKWHYDVMHPRQGCLLHGAEFVDILFTVMSRDAWICWQKHSAGWRHNTAHVKAPPRGKRCRS